MRGVFFCGRALVIGVAGILFLASPFAQAGMDAKQILLFNKVLTFLDKKPSAGAMVVVLPGAADLATMKTALSSMNIVEGGASDAAGAFAVFVNSATEGQAVKTKNPRALIISGDVGCVVAQACILSIETQPKVAISISRPAAAAAGITFDTSFNMLLTDR